MPIFRHADPALRQPPRAACRHCACCSPGASNAVARVKHSLQHCGFELHHNSTEALQIHCDYRPR
ncbi:hypothetical protein CCR98_12635 [Stenotrophomonas sp. WZN-1]|nr:hypothetical protein CCR98_12635 [Stenotrophomonas sp. WZN-1]